jgi:hypothetical protein
MENMEDLIKQPQSWLVCLSLVVFDVALLYVTVTFFALIHSPWKVNGQSIVRKIFCVAEAA